MVAVKNPAPAAGECAAALAGLREVVPQSFSVGFSVDLNAGAALLAGGDACYRVLAASTS